MEFLNIEPVEFGVVGPWQIVLVIVIILLLFGGKKLPELMKGLGQGINEFKKAAKPEDEKELESKEEKEA